MISLYVTLIRFLQNLYDCMEILYSNIVEWQSNALWLCYRSEDIHLKLKKEKLTFAILLGKLATASNGRDCNQISTIQIDNDRLKGDLT